jgi:membrane protein implicated in regulation of membrane protease activity
LSAYLTWAIIGLALIGFEMVTPSFFIIWFGCGALAAAAAAWLGFTLVPQLFVFIAVTLAGLLFSRKFARMVKGRETRTAYNALTGKIGIVSSTISASSGTGLVRVLGEEWSALAETERDLLPGEKVEIIGVSGVRALVRPYPNQAKEREEYSDANV